MTKQNVFEIDEDGAKRVDNMIETVKSAGLTEAAEMFSNVYAAWIKTTQAYVFGHPYLNKNGLSPFAAMHVVDTTFAYRADKIPGTPKLDDEGVLRDAADEEEWHRQEDRMMRREAGEPV